MVTFTLAVAVAFPPGPEAVSVYVSVLPGNTWRLPLALTVPIPGEMVTLLVSPVTLHRRVALCPRSMVDGSASNEAITGAAGLGASTFAGGGGGGVVGGGTFFLHPAANKLNISAIKMTPNRFLQLALYLSPILGAIPPESRPLLTPHRHRVFALGSQLTDLSTISKHAVYLSTRAFTGGKHDMLSIRRPCRVLVPTGSVRQLYVLA